MASLTLIKLFAKELLFSNYFFKEQNFVKEKIHFFWNIQDFFFNTKISNFINYSTNMCWICIYTIVLKRIYIILKIFWIHSFMCVFYIPWMCCGGYNFFLMCVINWIRCMGGWMICWHTSFTMGKKKNKEINEKIYDLKKWSSLWTNNQ